MDNKELKDRTKQFAHRCVALALSLPKSKLGYHLQGQLIRCSSSVATNYRAACLAMSKPAFISKLSIVIEEVDESFFWIEFIIDEGLVKKELAKDLLKESEELAKIFISSRMTATKK